MKNLRKQIIVKLQFEAIHCWPTCDIDEVSFLRYPHRHVFYITIKKTVNHNDRDIEIIMFKKEILNHLASFKGNIDNWSCETLAEYLLNTFNACSVEVLEDNENGAIVTHEK